MSTNIQKYLEMLGTKVRDRVTGFEGVVTSVGFDLFGCIQVIVTPPATSDGKRNLGEWFDSNRLETVDATPVMERPDFSFTKEAIAKGEKGPAEKPAWSKA